ncbi:30S ribosomal protein S4e [Candidatus Woesearchaeota archaeon]|nr:30S ribosomal protein S4e [Candidatus Woesearchaeota archaeon]
MKAHLKRIATPKTWQLARKESVFVTRPHPSGHGLSYSLSLATVLKDMIKCAKTTREVRYILQHKTVLVDGRRRLDVKFPVGLMDVVSLVDTDEHYRMTLTKRGMLAVVSVPKGEAGRKLSRIIGKAKLPQGKTQLNFSDGRNSTVEKDGYKVGDSLELALPDQAVKAHYPLQDGAHAMLVAGKYRGRICTIDKIEDDIITINIGGTPSITAKKHAFVVGKDKPAVTLG